MGSRSFGISVVLIASAAFAESDHAIRSTPIIETREQAQEAGFRIYAAFTDHSRRDVQVLVCAPHVTGRSGWAQVSYSPERGGASASAKFELAVDLPDTNARYDSFSMRFPAVDVGSVQIEFAYPDAPRVPGWFVDLGFLTALRTLDRSVAFPECGDTSHIEVDAGVSTSP